MLIFITSHLGFNIFFGLIAIAILVWSARVVVDRSVGLAKYYEVSEGFLGLTLLSISTSLPEIMTHVMASVWISTGGIDAQVASSVALGTNMGANILRQTLIFGAFLLLVKNMKLSKAFLQESFGPVILSGITVWLMALDGELGPMDGAILIFLFAIYIFYLFHYRTKRIEAVQKKKIIVKANPTQHRLRFGMPPHIQLGWIALGLLGLMLTSLYLIALAEWSVEELEIGGSLVGTLCLGAVAALPELLTAIRGVQKKKVELWVGILIGSNTINLLLGIGIGSLLTKLEVPLPWWFCDLPILVATALLTLVWLSFNKLKIGRLGAAYLLILYLIFLYLRLTYFMVD